MKEKIVSVLGTDYKVIYENEATNEKLANANGYCDQYAKKIVVDDLEASKDDLDLVENAEDFIRKTVRHEVIHAFLGESGLRSSSWAENEEMVDWFAIQFHKMASVFKELDV